jgi:hypothetical protein
MQAQVFEPLTEVVLYRADLRLTAATEVRAVATWFGTEPQYLAGLHAPELGGRLAAYVLDVAKPQQDTASEDGSRRSNNKNELLQRQGSSFCDVEEAYIS